MDAWLERSLHAGIDTGVDNHNVGPLRHFVQEVVREETNRQLPVLWVARGVLGIQSTCPLETRHGSSDPKLLAWANSRENGIPSFGSTEIVRISISYLSITKDAAAHAWPRIEIRTTNGFCSVKLGYQQHLIELERAMRRMLWPSYQRLSFGQNRKSNSLLSGSCATIEGGQ